MESARALLARNLVSLRQAKGLSQEALALEAGLHRTFVGHVERRSRNISLDNVERLARALGVPVVRLLELSPETQADASRGRQKKEASSEDT